MPRILTDVEAFNEMNADFEVLSRFDVIDVVHDDKRFPAIVTTINRHKREFFVLPIHRGAARRLITHGEQIVWEAIRLPNNPEDRRPRWVNLSWRSTR